MSEEVFAEIDDFMKDSNQGKGVDLEEILTQTGIKAAALADLQDQAEQGYSLSDAEEVVRKVALETECRG
jgi:hypothetical protein